MMDHSQSANRTMMTATSTDAAAISASTSTMAARRIAAAPAAWDTAIPHPVTTATPINGHGRSRLSLSAAIAGVAAMIAAMSEPITIRQSYQTTIGNRDAMTPT